MSVKIALLLGLLFFVNESLAAWLTTKSDVSDRNIKFETGLISNSGCLRLSMEGLFVALVANALYPVQPGRKSLFLSGHCGNGITVFNVVKQRAIAGESCTLVLVPNIDGSRGSRGYIQGEVVAEYEMMEKEFREWNAAGQVEIITITDKDDLQGLDISNVFAKIAALQTELDNISTEAIKQNTTCENDEVCKATSKTLNEELNKYYDGIYPGDKLTEEIGKMLKTKLDKLKSTEFDICFEGYRGLSFDTRQTAVTYPVLDFLVDLQIEQPFTTFVSMDYPVGLTEDGFQKEHAQYYPDTMIVIYLNESIVMKDDKSDNYQLSGIRIVQIDWITVATFFGISLHDTYDSPPPQYVAETKIHDCGFTYRTLLGMRTDVDKEIWDRRDTPDSPEVASTQGLQDPEPTPS